MPTNEDVVQTQVDAYNARDVDRFVRCYSSDAVVLDGEGNQMAKGHEGIRRIYTPQFERSPNLHCEVKKRIAVGQYVVHEEHVVGLNLEGHPPELELRGVTVYRISGGKIISVQGFF